MPRRNFKKTKVLLWTLLVVVVLMVSSQLIFSRFVKSKLKEKTPEHISLQYADLSTNLFLGNIQLDGVTIKNKQTSDSLKAQKIILKGLKYLPILSKKGLKINRLVIEAPEGTFRKTIKDSSKNRTAANGNAFLLSIKNIAITDGKLSLLKEESDSVSVALEKINLNLSDFTLDTNKTGQNLPFSFSKYKIMAQNLFFDAGPLNYLRLEQFQFNQDMASIDNLMFRPKYSREEFKNKVSVETEHLYISVDKVMLTQPDLFGSGKSKLHAPKMEIIHPVITSYRDKLMPPNSAIKKLPNQLLREMEMDLKIDSVLISDGEVNLLNRMFVDVVPEKIMLNNIQAVIKNLHNRGEGNVSLNVQNQIMDEGSFTLDYTFDPRSEDNSFVAEVSVKDFHTKKIAPFMRSTLNAEVDGTVNELYATIDGNEWSSRGDIKMAYDQFKYIALKKDHLHQNKLKSSIANLLTKKGDRRADEAGFRYGQFEVDRDHTKSIFNYIWVNVRTGMIHTMLGNGRERKK